MSEQTHTATISRTEPFDDVRAVIDSVIAKALAAAPEERGRTRVELTHPGIWYPGSMCPCILQWCGCQSELAEKAEDFAGAARTSLLADDDFLGDDPYEFEVTTGLDWDNISEDYMGFTGQWKAIREHLMSGKRALDVLIGVATILSATGREIDIVSDADRRRLKEALALIVGSTHRLGMTVKNAGRFGKWEAPSE